MWLNLLIILGTCIAGILFGVFAYWIIINIQKTLRVHRSGSMAEERPTPSTINDDMNNPSLEQPLNEVDYAQDIKMKTEDDDWLNERIPQASASTMKEEDDDWLNAEVPDVPANISKREDDDWLNGENDQSLETVDESSLNLVATSQREIQIKQDGSIFNITVTASNKQESKPGRTVINLRINLSPQVSTSKGEELYDIGVTADELSPSDLILQDIITLKPLDAPSNQNQLLMDDISVRPVENNGIQDHALMDEITVRPIQSPVIESPKFIDDINFKPVEEPVTEALALMDEISIRPPGPVNIEYELLDDLITKSAIYQAKKPKPTIDEVITRPVETPVERAEPSSEPLIIRPVESPVEKVEPSIEPVIIELAESIAEKTEPVKTFDAKEFSEFLDKKQGLKGATIATAATGTRKSSILSVDVPITIPGRVLLFSLAYLISIAIAELIIYRIYPAAGIGIYFIILFSLIINSVLEKDQSQRDLYIALGLAPVIRIILLAVPEIPVTSQYLWYAIASIPIIAGIVSVSRLMNFNLNDIGLNFNKLFVQFIVAVTGIGLAMVDYLILKPAPWTGGLQIQDILFPAIITLIFFGLIEELAYRGVMQRASAVLGSYGWIFIAAVYGVLQLWQGSVLHCAFAFGAGLFFGWIVKKTGSILGVSAAHGLMNVGLYLVLPYIFR